MSRCWYWWRAAERCIKVCAFSLRSIKEWKKCCRPKRRPREPVNYQLPNLLRSSKLREATHIEEFLLSVFFALDEAHQQELQSPQKAQKIWKDDTSTCAWTPKRKIKLMMRVSKKQKNSRVSSGLRRIRKLSYTRHTLQRVCSVLLVAHVATRNSVSCFRSSSFFSGWLSNPEFMTKDLWLFS